MQIVKHRSVKLSVGDIIDIIDGEKEKPKGLAINITDDIIVVEPMNCCNLFGDTEREDYETMYYKEK